MAGTKISNPSWARTFSAVLTSQPDKPAGRLAVVGIGNELNADDAVGGLVVRLLADRLGQERFHNRLILIQGGAAPENFTAPLRRFSPNVILLVDAVQMQSPPGKIAWLDWQHADGFSASTHTLPPSLFANYLIHEIGCRVILIGIQAESVEFDQPMNPQVKRAAVRLAGRLEKWLRSYYC